MNRKTLLALAVFGGLLIIVYYLRLRPERGERSGERPRPVPVLSKASIRRVTVTTAKSKVVLVREAAGATFRLTQPVAYAADKGAVEAMVERLTTLRFGDLVTELRSKHAELEVDAAHSVRVAVEDEHHVVADFHIGKVIDSFTMVRKHDEAAVYQAVDAMRYVFEREPKNWRDRTIIQFAETDARKLLVQTHALAGDEQVTLSRPDSKTPWAVAATSTAIDKLDTAAVTGVLTTLANLSAADFADHISLSDAGLATPHASIRVELADRSQRALLIGGNRQDDYYVKAQSGSQVFTVNKYTVDSLWRRPIDFRDKTIFDFDPSQLVAIEVHKLKDKQSVRLDREPDRRWLANGHKIDETAQIDQAAKGLAQLTAERFAVQSPDELGMSTPAWRIILRLANKRSMTLVVGSIAVENGYAVSRSGSNDLFIVSKYVLDRLLLNPAAYVTAK